MYIYFALTETQVSTKLPRVSFTNSQSDIFTSTRNLHFFPRVLERLATEIASHLFPTEHRFKLNERIGFSEISSQSYSNRKAEERYDLMPAPKKRNKLCEEEEESPNKRQKRIIEHNLASKAKSYVTSSKWEITKPVDEEVVATPEKSTTLRRKRLHRETKMKPKVITKPIDEETENQSCSLSDLIAKAKRKVKEKRQIDGRREYIGRKRLEARLAINRMVPTAAADDHLKYHYELLQLGCTFIHDQVTCLTKFSLRTSGLDGERKHGSTNRAKYS